jgi:trk system potassium uptake protein TrkA
MRYLIVGCGRVGSTLAKRLARAGHAVSVVDENSTAFRRLGRDFPGSLVLGTGIDVDVLKRAGADRADGFAAVTQGDNRNIMAALIAQQHFKINHVVARIYDPERSSMYRDFGISTICPTTVGARLMADALEEHAFRVLPYERPDVEIIEFVVGDAAHGKLVSDLVVSGKTQVCIVVRRDGASRIPTPEMRLEAGDRVVASVQPEYLDEYRKMIEATLAKAG